MEHLFEVLKDTRLGSISSLPPSHHSEAHRLLRDSPRDERVTRSARMDLAGAVDELSVRGELEAVCCLEGQWRRGRGVGYAQKTAGMPARVGIWMCAGILALSRGWEEEGGGKRAASAGTARG